MVDDPPIAVNIAGVDEGTRGGGRQWKLEDGLGERLHLISLHKLPNFPKTVF